MDYEDPTYFLEVPIEPTDCLARSKELMGDQYWLFVGICLVGMLIASAVPMGILMGPMMCGIYLCYLRRSRGQQAVFDDLFRGFDYFAESLIASLIYLGLSMLLMVPLGMLLAVAFFFGIAAAAQGGDEAVMIWMIVLLAAILVLTLAVGLVLGTLFAFVYLLIVDRRLKAVEAVKTSYRAVMANLGGVLGLALMNMVLQILGVCCCYVGAFFVMPFTVGATMVAYRKMFPALQYAQAEPAVGPYGEGPPPVYS